MIDNARALNADIANIEFRENAVAAASNALLTAASTSSIRASRCSTFPRGLPPATSRNSSACWRRAALRCSSSSRDRTRASAAGFRARAESLVESVAPARLAPPGGVRDACARGKHASALLERRPIAAARSGRRHAAGPGWHGRRWYVVNRDEVPVEVEAPGYRCMRMRAIRTSARADRRPPHDATSTLRCADLESGLRSSTRCEYRRVHGSGRQLVGGNGRVIAVEPIPRNLALIERSCRATVSPSELIRAAASDRSGEIELRTHRAHRTVRRRQRRASACVRRRRRDDAGRRRGPGRGATSLTRLDLVKIDVEGMEPRALRGLSVRSTAFIRR